MSFELSFMVLFATAGLASFCVASLCEKPLSIFMRRIIQNETSSAFTKYVRYVTCLVGISHGVTVNALSSELKVHILERLPILRVPSFPEWWIWLIGILTVIMQSLTAIASMYLVFFIFGFVAYITVKVVEK